MEPSPVARCIRQDFGRAESFNRAYTVKTSSPAVAVDAQPTFLGRLGSSGQSPPFTKSGEDGDAVGGGAPVSGDWSFEHDAARDSATTTAAILSGFTRNS